MSKPTRQKHGDVDLNSHLLPQKQRVSTAQVKKAFHHWWVAPNPRRILQPANLPSAALSASWRIRPCPSRRHHAVLFALVDWYGSPVDPARDPLNHAGCTPPTHAYHLPPAPGNTVLPSISWASLLHLGATIAQKHADSLYSSLLKFQSRTPQCPPRLRDIMQWLVAVMLLCLHTTISPFPSHHHVSPILGPYFPSDSSTVLESCTQWRTMTLRSGWMRGSFRH